MALPSDLCDLTIAGARDALASGDVSARELTEAHLAAMEGARDLNIFITETSLLSKNFYHRNVSTKIKTKLMYLM